MKFLIDMNLSPKWVTFLHDADYHAVHWSVIGLATATDHEIIEHARQQEFVILSHDLDFSAILAASGTKMPSVIQLRTTNVSPEFCMDLLLKAIQQTADELTVGAILSVNINDSRLRILPL